MKDVYPHLGIYLPYTHPVVITQQNGLGQKDMKLYIKQFMTVRPYKLTDEGFADCDSCCAYVNKNQYCMNSFCCTVIKKPLGSMYFAKGYEAIY